MINHSVLLENKVEYCIEQTTLYTLIGKTYLIPMFLKSKYSHNLTPLVSSFFHISRLENLSISKYITDR